MRFEKSSRKNKKYMVEVDGKKVHFGDTRYQHYKDKIGLYSHLDHLDKERRRRYRTRHSNIILSDGIPAYKRKYSPAWFSYHYLW